MKRSTWRILAFGALLGAVALPASAQVVIGGSGTPSVVVNWSVLDSLGRQPTLPDMLKSSVPGAESRVDLSQSKSKGVQYRPYKAGAKPYAKAAKASHAAPKPKKSQVVPASAKTERMAELVQKSVAAPPVAAQPAKVESAKAPVAEAPKPAAPAIVGPQIALPEVPKPAATTAPVQLAKAEPAPAPAPVIETKVEAKADPVALPPTALTPPPMPVAKVEAPVEPVKVEVPPQIASLPPTPAPAPVVSSHTGDTLSVPFAAESARLPDGVRADLDRLVKRMQKDDSLGLQLLAYAEGDDVNASKARRLSLSRALEVRKYLMEQGLRSTRIEVRALGNKLEGGGPADRVDAVLVGR